MHKLIISGNLGNDPDMRYTPKGTAVTKFRVASREYSGKTMWFRCTAWNKQAENCNEYLEVGQHVDIVGELETDENGNMTAYERKDGTWAVSQDVRVVHIEFGPKGKSNRKSKQATEQEPPF